MAILCAVTGCNDEAILKLNNEWYFCSVDQGWALQQIDETSAFGMSVVKNMEMVNKEFESAESIVAQIREDYLSEFSQVDKFVPYDAIKHIRPLASKDTSVQRNREQTVSAMLASSSELSLYPGISRVVTSTQIPSSTYIFIVSRTGCNRALQMFL